MHSLFLLTAMAADPVPRPDWMEGRVWPDDPAVPPAIAEQYPQAPASLGAQVGLHRLSLDGCWRQHAALATDLDLWFCAEAKVGRGGAARVRMASLSDPRPGLARCIEATLESWAGPTQSSAEGMVCRAVATHISDEAREVWAVEPWAEVPRPGRESGPSEAGMVELGRPAVERATRLRPAPEDGTLVPAPHPLTLRDRTVSTARRYLGQSVNVVSGCWADHGGWRPPETTDDPDVLLSLTVFLSVGETGVDGVRAGRSAPETHRSVADCVAARLDPGVGPGEGSVEVEVPLSIRRVGGASPAGEAAGAGSVP